jgi:hypothetical protein
MSVDFNNKFLGGVLGLDVMPAGETTLYYTVINGEMPNTGLYTGPTSVQLNYEPRESGLIAFVDGNKTYPRIQQGKFIELTYPAAGILTVRYAPQSELIYFGQNADSVSFGSSSTSKMQNVHLSNIMYKIAQIEYATQLPITMWYGKEVTTVNYNDYNFMREPTVVYSLQTRLNEIISIINTEYDLNIDVVSTTSDINRILNVEDIMELRRRIVSIQNALGEIL